MYGLPHKCKTRLKKAYTQKHVSLFLSVSWRREKRFQRLTPERGTSWRCSCSRTQSESGGTPYWSQRLKNFSALSLLKKPSKLGRCPWHEIVWYLRVRPEPARVEHLSVAPVKGKLLTLPAYFRLSWKHLSGTNNLTYLASSSVAKV